MPRSVQLYRQRLFALSLSLSRHPSVICVRYMKVTFALFRPTWRFSNLAISSVCSFPTTAADLPEAGLWVPVIETGRGGQVYCVGVVTTRTGSTDLFAGSPLSSAFTGSLF